MSLRARAILNVLSNWGGQVFAVVLSFFLTPFVVHSLGNDAYGVWTLMAAIAGYMALLDLGVRGAVTRYVAGFSTAGNDENASRVASSALQIFLATSAVVVAGSTLLALFAVDRFSIPEAYRTAARVVLVLAGLNVGVSLVSGVFSGIVAALQRFDRLNLLEVGVAAVRAAAFVAALETGQGLMAMAAIQLLVSVARGVWLSRLCRRLYPALRIHLLLADRRYLKLIFSFSAFTFLIHISGRVIYYTDALIIGTFLPIGLLTFFSIGGTLVDHARALMSSVSFTTSPMASSLDALGHRSRVERLLLESARFSMMILLPVAVTFVLRGEAFIGLWMGPSYAGPAGAVLAILTLPLFFHAGSHGLGGIMMGIGKHKPLAAAMVVEGCANLALSLALVGPLGIAGVAWGTTIPSVVSSLFFWPWYVQRAVGIRPGLYFSTIWGRPVLAVLPFALCTYIVERLFPASSLVGFAAQVGSCLIVAGAGYWWVCFSRAERDALVAVGRRRVSAMRTQASTG